MARAVVVAVLLMQCCNVILAARPLLHAGRLGGEALVSQPGQGNCSGFKGVKHPPCPPAATTAAMP
ncbi:hypothetical protein BAE44_0025184 [Dichanthelium oligosanthes]|uniref:Uncharacterized protein n=1 Tax=Dichanthelium oligosanthes TaxID=888268 RepID=A0A1E5ULR2_9POAL|nr:hypothetical protein BAE44_0025184 [Dichanthelium oligosanthes]